MEAASAGRFKIIKVLIEHGATPTSVTDNVDFKVGLVIFSLYMKT